MQQGGKVIYLAVSPAELARRLAPAKAHRPLIAAVPDEDLPAFIAELLARREPFYQQADLILSSPNLSDLLTAIRQLS
jgi:shikimate kinase